MKIYLFEFEAGSEPSEGSLVYGVTARDQDDAIKIMITAFGSDVFIDDEYLMKADIVIDELDEGHIIPNMGSIFERGIWFPLGH